MQKNKQHEINKDKLCQISLELFFRLQLLQRSFLEKIRKKFKIQGSVSGFVKYRTFVLANC